MRRFLQSGLIAVAALALVTPAAPALASSAGGGGGGALAPVGSAAAVPSTATALGALPDDQTISFDVVLKPRNQAALDQFVQDVSTPGSAHYHQFLKTGEYAQRFGPTPQTITAVRNRLSGMGLHPAAAVGSIISVTGTSSVVSSALHTRLTQVKLRSGRVARANTLAPKLPADIAPYVQTIAGLDTIAQLQHGPTHPQGLAPQTAGPTNGCIPNGSAAAGYYNANQLASYYQLDSYYPHNQLGAGIHVALFELEGFTSTDISHYKSCYGVTTQVNTKVVAGPSSGDGGEATLDIEDLIGLVPASTIDVYEGLNSGSGILNVYNRIASDNTAQVVSTSWGACEADFIPLLSSERTIFQQMAAQGQTVLAASGDSGSEACSQASATDTSLSVGDPASQPEVTGVGGTDLTDNTTPGSENVWNDAATGNGAGGGGISQEWTMPAWQTSAIIGDSSGTPCGASAGTDCRQVPDVSASASPSHAYLVYWSGTSGLAWYYFGGTSAAAPTWASVIALVDASCAGNRVGLINPALYSIAASSFNDVTSGDNDYTGDHPGSYTAQAGYDLASGLGTPKALSVGQGLCPAIADGGGTAVVDHTSVGAASSNTLTFTYAPPSGQTMYDGEVSIVVPAGWTAPTTTPGNPGYTTSSSGTVSVTGTGPWTIDVQHADTLSGNLTIKYGNTVGGGAAVAPNASARSVFTAAARSTMGAGSLTNLAASPHVDVALAADGSGTMSVAPTSVNIDATGQTLTFTYTPPTNVGLAQGEVDIAVPAGWTAPSTSSSNNGYFTASTGATGVSGQTMQITGVDLNPGQHLTVVYGDKSGTGSGATVSNNPGSVTFTTSEKSAAVGSVTALTPTSAQPVVQVITGTMTVSPSSVTTSSTTSLKFTYTPVAGAPLTNGTLAVTIPAGWSVPQTADATAAGFVSQPTTAGTTGVLTVAGRVITIPSVNLTTAQTLSFTYGDTTSDAGGAATAPGSAGTSTFGTTEQLTNVGLTHAVAANPAVTVMSAGGGGGGGGGGGFGHPDLTRVAGADRIATSVAASQAAFAQANSARVAVLARADSFADALSGTPLAASQGGPLLLTNTAAAPAATLAELDRVLPRGDTIYLLGGTSAISAGVQTQLTGMGYSVTRLAGADRFATAVAVAGALNNPTTVFEADGTNFPDALSAGSAAAQQGAAVLLTSGGTQSAATAGYLSAHPSVRYAVGGPAAKADPGATPFVGADRFATSVLVATRFFNAPLSVGLASGMNFPDALSGGAVTASHGGPILLVPSTGTVSAGTTNYLTKTAALSASSAWLFGGTVSVSDSVFSQSAAALKAS